MKRSIILIVLVTLGSVTCGARPPANTRGGLKELKRELAHAQKELAQAQEHVRQLEEAIAHKEILRIQKEIGKIEKANLASLMSTRDERLAFFCDQRETLSTIIHKHPICALQAQAVLDQILTLITHMSDEVID